MIRRSLLDRILGREATFSPSINVAVDNGYASPKPPHDYCGKCGEPMVVGWVVTGRGFDRQTGQPIQHVRRNRMCLTLHRKDFPYGEVLSSDPEWDHDGLPWSPWGDYFIGDEDTVPDCEPRKTKAAK